MQVLIIKVVLDLDQREAKRKNYKTREPKRRRETSQLSFMLSGSVSGPFVVRLSIPQPTTTGRIKCRGTERRKEQVCEFSHQRELSLRIVRVWILASTAILFQSPVAMLRANSRHIPYRRRSTRSHGAAGRGNPKRKQSCREAHSQETRDNKPSIALKHCVLLFRHVREYLCVLACYSCLQVSSRSFTGLTILVPVCWLCTNTVHTSDFWHKYSTYSTNTEVNMLGKMSYTSKYYGNTCLYIWSWEMVAFPPLL